MAQAIAYGWRDFDSEVVSGLLESDPRYVVKSPEGGMACPLASHEREWLSWEEGRYKKGTTAHGDPGISLRVSPTFVLTEPRANFVVGPTLIDQILQGDWGKAETWRLGNENSEDALTWNVFRSLQQAGLLHLLSHRLVGAPLGAEPDLYLWGRRITESAAEKWKDLQKVRDELEKDYRQQTEPDTVLHVRGWGWIFVEAKFGSRVTTSPNEERMKKWLEIYPVKVPAVFNHAEIRGVTHQRFPEQLLRNVVFASEVARLSGEKAYVVLLAREKELTPVEDWLQPCLAPTVEVGFSRLSWEEIYRLLPSDGRVATLRAYMEEKSYALRRAFAIQ